MPTNFFLLTKENVELATDEIVAISKCYDRTTKYERFDNLVVINSNVNWQKIAKRATFVKTGGQVLNKLSNLFLEKSNHLLLNSETFACKTINLSSKKMDVNEIEDNLGNLISKFSKAKVSLDNPDVIIYVICTKTTCFFGISNKLEKSPRPKKLVSHPHELDWKLSRVMINLAGLKENQTVCDPFCGTGTTLLEAESMGIKSIGIDFDEKMYVASKNNVTANDYDSKIINANYSHLKKIIDQYDGVVTDVPYGMASKSSEVPQKLFQNLISIIPKRKKFVVMCKKGFENKIKFKPSKKYEIYRHKSLTRTIMVK